MKLLPFNLERALAGEKVITRDGQEVTQLHLFDIDNYYYPLYGVINSSIEVWNKDGKFYKKDEIHQEDLFMAPKTQTYYLNLYVNQDGVILGSTANESEETAKYLSTLGNDDFNIYLKTISFEVEIE